MLVALKSQVLRITKSGGQFLRVFYDFLCHSGIRKSAKIGLIDLGLPILICMILISCDPKELPTIFLDTTDRIVLGFSHQTTRGEITTIQDTLAKKGMMIDVTGSEFFENGHLRVLNLKVVFPGGAGGKTRADLMTIQHNYVGFEFDRTKSPGFVIGQLKK